MPEIKLLNQDCMELLRETPDKFYELAIVDPPYGIGVSKMAYTQEDKRRVLQKNGSRMRIRKGKYEHKEWDSTPPSTDYFLELNRVSKNQIIWGVNYMPHLLNGGRIVWDKLNGENTFSDCEIAFTSCHNNSKMFRYMWSGMCQGKSISEGHVQQGNKQLNEIRIHPTQKPVKLYKWLLRNYAKEGDKILDTHLGSGSIAIACHDLGFSLTATEIDKDYYDAAVKRFNLHKSQLQLPLTA